MPGVLRAARKPAIKHTTRSPRALVRGVAYRMDISALQRDLGSGGFGLNEIGRVTLQTVLSTRTWGLTGPAPAVKSARSPASPH